MADDDIESRIEDLVSRARYAPYLGAAGGDTDVAARLYEWNVALTAASFEAFHYLEIVVRNAMDREIADRVDETRRGIPWFLVQVVTDQKSQRALAESVERVRNRLRLQSPGRDSREQFIAGTDFGFWTELLHGPYEQLWRDALHKAFRGSSGRRKDVLAVLDKLRLFRNRLAHHDSLLLVDVPSRLDEMDQVLTWIDPLASRWLRRNERITATYAARPVAPSDTVVVPARDAWPLYEAVGAYVCQAGRSFRPIERIAFYADSEVKREVPRVRGHWDHVEWSEQEAERLRRGDSAERRLSEIIVVSRGMGWTDGRNQVFDLTRPGEADHRTLDRSVTHTARGRGSAFVQGQRYTAMADLARAVTTADLAPSQG